MDNLQLLQDLIDGIDSDIKEQEKQLVAVHAGITITKQIRSKLVAKKRSLEEIEKEKGITKGKRKK